MKLRFRHKIKYSYDFGNTLPITGTDIGKLIDNEPQEIAIRLSNVIDITTFDSVKKENYINVIKALYQKTVKEDTHLIEIINSVHNRIEEFKQSIPMVFISDDKPKRTYGLYDYKEIKVETERLLAVYRENHSVRRSLEEVLDILRKEFEIKRIEIKEQDVLNDESWLDEIVEILKQVLWRVDSPESEKEINEFIDKIKNIKFTSRTLGVYNTIDNLIVLYIYNICDSIRSMPVSSPKEALLNAARIVLNHEMFHAFHYFCIGDDKDERDRNWSYNTRPHTLQDSVMEGLATAWEYQSCPRVFRKIDVYDDWREKRKKEFNNHGYPDWPYSAAKEILFNKPGIDNDDNVKLVALFYVTAINNKYRWRIAYVALSKYLNNTRGLKFSLRTNKKDLVERIARRNIDDDSDMITDNKSEAIQKSVYKRYRAEE